MQNQPSNSPQVPAASCGHATASLVCGIVAVFLGPISGIPAIITGHIALSKIKKSGTSLKGRGLAIAGLILGYIGTFFIPVLAGLAFAGTQSAMKKAKTVQTLNMAVSVQQAISSYYDEFGSLPMEPPSATPFNTAGGDGVSLLKVLLAEESGTTQLNPRGIRFLAAKTAKLRKNGLDYGTGTTVLGMYDAWGAPFYIALDHDYNEEIANPDKINAADPAVLRGFKAVVYSAGADGVIGTKDDVRSW